jgi:hypothetical protein
VEGERGVRGPEERAVVDGGDALIEREEKAYGAECVLCPLVADGGSGQKRSVLPGRSSLIKGVSVHRVCDKR